ncbi:MAG: nucleotidyltransferase family protein, partial [Pyrinomonadaceae bacterium]
HWAFTGSLLPFRLDISSLWGRIESITFQARTVPHFAAEDLLIILCAHGAKHAWDGTLRTLCDLAELTLCARPLNWDRIEACVDASQCWRMVTLALVLACELLNANVPERFLRKANEDIVLKSLLPRALKGLFRDSGEPMNPFPFYVSLMCPHR